MDNGVHSNAASLLSFHGGCVGLVSLDAADDGLHSRRRNAGAAAIDLDQISCLFLFA
jgi:hypothetical protein